jgi:hypothetical protein
MQSFPTTRWSLLEAMGHGGDPQARRVALEKIILRYNPALRGHIVRKNLARADEIDDLLQSFIADRILASDLLGRSDQSRGKFRHFIRRVLSDYAVEQRRIKAARKRSPGHIASLADTNISPPNSSETADREFDRDWAKQVVSEAIRQMEQECARVERDDLWEVFEARMLKPLFDNAVPESYEQLADRLDNASAAQASNLLVTCKRMFCRVVRDVVSEYLCSEGNVEDEIRDLFAALASPQQSQRPKLA